MYLGIDFSGAARPWRPRCHKPTVWIATVEDGKVPRLTDVIPVQSLTGDGSPFDRLVTLLHSGKFRAAGIDAPFAIPVKYLPAGGHRELLDRIRRVQPAVDRPFASGAALIELAAAISMLDQKKPYRETEKLWIERGVNTRSALWNGPRGGAAFTAACLTLLARSERPVWPWKCGPGMLVEAFPAAQLRSWGLPHSGYSKPEQNGVRADILDGLAKHIQVSESQRVSLMESPDALDSVISSFAAIAAVRKGTTTQHPADGLIAVMDSES